MAAIRVVLLVLCACATAAGQAPSDNPSDNRGEAFACPGQTGPHAGPAGPIDGDPASGPAAFAAVLLGPSACPGSRGVLLEASPAAGVDAFDPRAPGGFAPRDAQEAP